VVRFRGSRAEPAPPGRGSAGRGSAGRGSAGRGSAATATIAQAAPSGAPGAGGSAGVLARTNPQRIGEHLLAKGAISADQLEEALHQQSDSGRKLGEVLVEIGLLDERLLAEVLAEQYGLTVVDLRPIAPSPEALALIPESVARGLTAIPTHAGEGLLEVVVADPSYPGLMTSLVQAAGSPVALSVGTTSDIRGAIDRAYRALAGVDRHVREFSLTSGAARTAIDSEVQQAVQANAPVVEVVNLILTQGVRDRASDVHIEPQGDQVRVRMRIDGALHDVLTLPPEMGPALVSRIKVMAGMNIVERRRSQDGQIETSIDGHALDVRVSTTPVIFGEKTVLRLLDKSRSLYEVRELGMSPETSKVFEELIRSPFGMIICTGPTGSGKTTSLYATLGAISSVERNVMTIEDPVEYVMPAINQIQINEAADLTFAGGLKSILRQDPDVILVGEIRDVETARIAVQSALTGHFVLSSLHATDSVSAVHRFLDMGIESFLIAPALLAVVGQRLVRRICPSCTAVYTPPPEELLFYETHGGTPKTQFVHGEGCNFCSGTGYQERIGVYEVLQVTEAIRQMIVDLAPASALREQAMREGMRPLRQEALRLVSEDVTTISEILRSVYPL
jgi:type IV pilus assembly protein PilB